MRRDEEEIKREERGRATKGKIKKKKRKKG